MVRQTHLQASRATGFTTLELLIALTIVGLLISVAVLSWYDHAVAKERRHAWLALQDVADWQLGQQRQFGQFSTGPLPIRQSPAEGDPAYTLSLAPQAVKPNSPELVFPASDAAGFTLQATPADAEDPCGVLLLNHLGQRGVTGAKPLRDCLPK